MPVFATYFTPSGARKGCRNAIMKVFFSDGGLKKLGFREFNDVSLSRGRCEYGEAVQHGQRSKRMYSSSEDLRRMLRSTRLRPQPRGLPQRELVLLFMMTLGHVHLSSLMLRLASHHLAVSCRLTVDRMTPLACRAAPAPAAAPTRSSHTASRNARRC